MIQSDITGQLVIPTARFSLRPVRNSDVGLIEMFGEDKRLAEMTTHIPHPLPPGATAAFLDRVTKQDSDEQVWAIDGSKDGLGELLGMISMKKVTQNQSEISYWVANPSNDSSLVASVFQDNPASAKIVTNMGFVLIGESEVYSVARKAMVNTWDYVLRLED